MKLLVCASEYFPHGSGIANVAYYVVEQLKKKGVECTVCSPTGPDIKLGSQRLIQRTGIVGLIYYWYCVSRYFKENNYDVIWLHNPFIFQKRPSWKCLVTMHSTYYGESIHDTRTALFLRIYRIFVSIVERYCLTHLNKNTRFTGVGQPVCEELKTMGIDYKQISYVPNGVDVQTFKSLPNKTAIRKKYRIPENDIIFLSVGRLTPHKQPQTMIETHSILTNGMENLSLCIAGNGELLDDVKKLVDKEGIHKVIFLGYVDHKDLPELYASADYYIITSSYEGFPLTLSEAMASGLPCIVSDIPNFRIVYDAKCGIIVNFKDTERAAEEILEYVTRDNSYHAKNAREYAIHFFDWEIISKQYLKIFEAIHALSDKRCD